MLSDIGKAYRQNLAERRAAGQPVEACLPPEAEIDSDTLFAHLIGYSADQAHRTSIAEAFSKVGAPALSLPLIRPIRPSSR